MGPGHFTRFLIWREAEPGPSDGGRCRPVGGKRGSLRRLQLTLQRRVPRGRCARVASCPDVRQPELRPREPRRDAASRAANTPRVASFRGLRGQTRGPPKGVSGVLGAAQAALRSLASR